MIVITVILRALSLNKLPKKTYLALWGIVLARLLIPYSLPCAFSAYSLITQSAADPPAANTSISSTPGASAADTPGMVDMTPNPVTAPIITDHFPGNTADITPAAPAASAPTAAPAPLIDTRTAIWLIGMLACAVFFAVTYIKCLRRFGESLPVDSEFIEQWLAEHRLHRRISVCRSDRITSPLTYGIFRPVILLPKGFGSIGSDDLNFVLTHEYIHIRRFDTAFKLLLTAAICVHWFNPAVWVMYIIANRDIEISCDEAVIRIFGYNERAAYATALIHLEEIKSGLIPLSSSFGKNPIKERIVTIMNFKKATTMATIAAACLVVGTTTVFATTAKAPDNDAVQQTSEPTTESTSSVENSAPVEQATAPAEESKPDFSGTISLDEWASKPHVLPSAFAPEDLDFVHTTNPWGGIVTTIPAECDSEVYAVDDGEVICAGYFKIEGYSVIIKHADNLYTCYFHLLFPEQSGKTPVRTGDTVKAGQCIGYAGITGMTENYCVGYSCITDKQKIESILNSPSRVILPTPETDPVGKPDTPDATPVVSPKDEMIARMNKLPPKEDRLYDITEIDPSDKAQILKYGSETLPDCGAIIYRCIDENGNICLRIFSILYPNYGNTNKDLSEHDTEPDSYTYEQAVDGGIIRG